jgi:hypothetical protein
MKTIFAFLLATFVNADGAERLDVPSIITVNFQPARTNYMATYTITNNTAETIQIAGKATSCGCASVSLLQDQIGPRETAQVAVNINSVRPSTNSVLLIDSGNNIYHTRVEIVSK